MTMMMVRQLRLSPIPRFAAGRLEAIHRIVRNAEGWFVAAFYLPALSIYLLMKCAWREPGTALSFEAASWRRRFHWTARHRRQLEHLENLEPTHRHHRIIIIIISS